MASPSLSTRPTYTQEQLEQYFDYIKFPKDHRITAEAADTEEGLKFLQRLIKYQLAAVPFENLDLHYSTHHAVSIDEEHVFQKVVERKRGRGGYCMQNNGFFGTVMRTIGFSVMPVGARVNAAAENASVRGNPDLETYSGWSHTVNVITIENKKYFVDVGFGSAGPTLPVPLVEGYESINVGDSSGGTLLRLIKDSIAQNTHHTAEQRLWIFQARFNENMSWFPVYCFTEVEFLPQDLRIANYWVSRHPTSWFTQDIVCQKFLMEEGTEKLIGDLTLANRAIKERRYGKSKRLVEIKTEADRVNALERFLGITLDKPEINGIKRMITEIK